VPSAITRDNLQAKGWTLGDTEICLWRKCRLLFVVDPCIMSKMFHTTIRASLTDARKIFFERIQRWRRTAPVFGTKKLKI
jgi:hypothetical protein